MDSFRKIGARNNRKRMIGKYQINGSGCCLSAECQIYILEVQDPLLNTKEADVAYVKA